MQTLTVKQILAQLGLPYKRIKLEHQRNENQIKLRVKYPCTNKKRTCYGALFLMSINSSIVTLNRSTSASVYVPSSKSLYLHNGGHKPSIPTHGRIKNQSTTLGLLSVDPVDLRFCLRCPNR